MFLTVPRYHCSDTIQLMKFKIKTDSYEFEFEGDVHDLESSAIQKLIQGRPFEPSSKEFSRDDLPEEKAYPLEENQPQSGRPFLVEPITTAGILIRLNKGTDGKSLTFAAMLKLRYVDEKSTFTRKEVLDEMKSATAFYKQANGKHLSDYLKGLSRERLINEYSIGVYTIVPNPEVESLLRNISAA